MAYCERYRVILSLMLVFSKVYGQKISGLIRGQRFGFSMDRPDALSAAAGAKHQNHSAALPALSFAGSRAGGLS